MTKLKLLTAAAVLTSMVAAPAMAQDAVVYRHHHHYHHVGPVGAAVGTAAGIAGAAIGTAGAIATAPFRDSYNYYDRDRGYDYDHYMGPNGYACHPGTWFRGADGRRHICQ
jgi:predicted secreted Zn-dependent protease